MSRRDPALDDISVLNDPNWTPPTANDIVSHTIATAAPTTTTATTTDAVAVRVCCFHLFAVVADAVPYLVLHFLFYCSQLFLLFLCLRYRRIGPAPPSKSYPFPITSAPI